MSEETWDIEEAAPPPKKGLPRWLWFGCGCGCLVSVLAAAALSVLGYRFVQEGSDAEKQWPRLEKVLPFDERPPYELQFGTRLFGSLEQYTLLDPERDLLVTIRVVSSRAELDSQLAEELEGVPLGMGSPRDAESGEIEIQGRRVRVLRFAGLKGEFGEALGAGLRVDLSDDLGPRLGELRRRGGEGGDRPIPDEDVQAFFAPFHVWRER